MTNDEAIYVLKNTAWLGWDKQKEKVTEAVRMAVEALKTQLPKEDTTSDCISRHEAIDAVRHAWAKGLEPSQYIEDLPPAQPEERTEERTETHACDCVSRQAAIDALGGNEPVGDPSKMDDDDVVKMWERIRIINIINKLPSVQPERKTGQWILADTYDGRKRYRCSECLSFALKTDDGQENLSDYCPVCGARMEGEDDGTD